MKSIINNSYMFRFSHLFYFLVEVKQLKYTYLISLIKVLHDPVFSNQINNVTGASVFYGNGTR